MVAVRMHESTSIEGVIAGAASDFILLLTAGITVGAATGALVAWVVDPVGTDWERGLGSGTVYGVYAGLALALLDLGLEG